MIHLVRIYAYIRHIHVHQTYMSTLCCRATCCPVLRPRHSTNCPSSMDEADEAELERFGSGSGYECAPLAMETFRHLEYGASRSMCELGDVVSSDARIHAYVSIHGCVLSMDSCEIGQCKMHVWFLSYSKSI